MEKKQSVGRDKFIAQTSEAIRQALDTIKNNKARSGLVILGVLIGVASLMGMVSVLSGLNDLLTSSISGGNTPIVTLQKVDIGGDFREQMKRKDFKVETAEYIARLPHVEAVQFHYARQFRVKYKDQKSNFIGVIGTNPEFLRIQSLSVGKGRFFSREDMNRRRPYAILGEQTGISLFPDEDPIGKMIRINGRQFEVKGVMAKRNTIFGSLADNFVVIPYTRYERDFLQKFDALEFNIIVDKMENLDIVEDDLRALMRMRRKVSPGEPDDFAIITVDAAVEFTEDITKNIALVMVVLASIALMIGGIGVMVIMLVSVTERTREIGIRKAVGATSGQITLQFLIEAATLSGIGGILGILTGAAIAFGLSLLLGFPFKMPLDWTFISFAASASVGLFFGIFPARKAAKLDPIVALSYE